MIIQEQLEKDIIKRVKDESPEGLHKHYISHHTVVTLTKSITKVPIVYDVSAKTKETNKSLNKCLLWGPVKLLCLCCLHTILCSQCRKGVLSIVLQQQKRDVTRFLCLKDSKNVTNEENLEVFQFCRVPFSVVSSPFLLGANIAHYLK